MFRSKTLFILGAGSSAEVEMPVGEKIKDIISDKLDIVYNYQQFGKQVSGDRGIARAFFRHSKDRNHGYEDNSRYVEKAQQLRRALPHAISIDNLLDAHRGDEIIEICGKLGIFQSILNAERDSKLYSKAGEKVEFEAIGETWFSEFVKILTEDVPRSEFEGIFANVSFINFNYDRCLEHYLLQALSDYYNLDEKSVVATMKKLKVLRPYGSVGALPWQDNNPNWTIPFGSDIYSENNHLYQQDKGEALLSRAQMIKTFNEKQHDQEALRALHTLVAEAETIVFLGFAFHRQNIELINPNSICNAKNLYVTVLGISNSDWTVIQRDLFKLLGQKHPENAEIHAINSMCSSLFKEYRRSLTS